MSLNAYYFSINGFRCMPTSFFTDDLPNFSPLSLPFVHALGEPQATAKLKATPQDFLVEEQLAFELSGEGEHLWLWVEKENANTDLVAREIAKFLGLPSKHIGVAGKKDRYAVTRQWMSCYLPGKVDPDLNGFDMPGVRILNAIRHRRKLQTGGHSGNRFEITLREVSGEKAHLEERLQWVAQNGFPNYFGEQRFGRSFGNLAQATAMFEGTFRPKRFQKTLYLSAVRSWLFNEILHERLLLGNWNQFVPGDVLQLEGSQKWFAEDGDASLVARVTEQDLHPTGALFGRGQLDTKASVAELEKTVLNRYPHWLQGLENAGLKQDRRALRVLAHAFNWTWSEDNVLVIRFHLPPGSFATALIRELVAAHSSKPV